MDRELLEQKVREIVTLQGNTRWDKDKRNLRDYAIYTLTNHFVQILVDCEMSVESANHILDGAKKKIANSTICNTYANNDDRYF